MCAPHWRVGFKAAEHYSGFNVSYVYRSFHAKPEWLVNVHSALRAFLEYHTFSRLHGYRLIFEVHDPWVMRWNGRMRVHVIFQRKVEVVLRLEKADIYVASICSKAFPSWRKWFIRNAFGFGCFTPQAVVASVEMLCLLMVVKVTGHLKFLKIQPTPLRIPANGRKTRRNSTWS